jgi:hypothetical protein
MKRTILASIVLIFSFTITAMAQGVSLTTTATASAVKYGGSWGAATHETEALPFLYWGASKGNFLSLNGEQLIAPGFGWSIYGAGAGITPDISALIAKTTLSPDQLTVTFSGFGGVATLTNSTNKVAWGARGTLSYAFNPNLAMTTVYAGGGGIGAQRFYEMSAGLLATINPQASPSAAVKRMVRKAAQLKMMKATMTK